MTENESKEWEIKDPNAPDNTTQEKQQEVKNEPPKSVQDSIASAVQQFSSFQDQINNTSFNKKKSKEKPVKTKKGGGFAGFIVSIITLVFLFVILCIAITYMVKPEVDAEAEDIVNRIDELEMAYYSTFNSFHFIKETSYDKILDVDLSGSKYFTAFEVVPKKSDDVTTEKCEINLYGAKGIFSIAFCYINASIDKFLGDGESDDKLE
ncbi:MAG: hypothetical protein J6T23_07370 [Elusimicrobia bacterium]|nr:hypothetical protein [Elusimicrobiota bacterium]